MSHPTQATPAPGEINTSGSLVRTHALKQVSTRSSMANRVKDNHPDDDGERRIGVLFGQRTYVVSCNREPTAVVRFA